MLDDGDHQAAGLLADSVICRRRGAASERCQTGGENQGPQVHRQIHATRANTAGPRNKAQWQRTGAPCAGLAANA
jgi:hypothetical protein